MAGMTTSLDGRPDLVAWLAGPSTGYVNGTSLSIDGGRTVR